MELGKGFGGFWCVAMVGSCWEWSQVMFQKTQVFEMLFLVGSFLRFISNESKGMVYLLVVIWK